jgi:hypothetical protein
MSTVAANCPNCETPTSGNFCSNCGQETVLHHASTREFLHEFVGHYVALEGKLWGSLTRLLFRPGLLTNEYIRGRRVRFVQPLRLYLTLSLLFFALLQFTGFDPVVDKGGNKQKMAPSHVGAEKTGKVVEAPAAATGKAKAAEAASAASAGSGHASAPGAESPEDKAEPAGHKDKSPDADESDDDGDIDRWLSGWPKVQHQWQIFHALSNEEQKKVFAYGFYHYVPYAIFCLMPVFALMLKVLYLGSGRRFGEHVLFALHANAFAYLVFCLVLVIPFGLARFALWCWVLGYLPWAMRRVYHSSRFTTFLRWSVLMFFFSVAVSVAVVGSMLAGIMSAGH